MKCLVTAGPTYEPLDEVRRLTNFSSGRLGSELVNYLAARGHEVRLLIGQQATWRGERHARHVETFTTAADLHKRLRALARKPVEAVFHAAAVSDFRFGKIWRRSAQGKPVQPSSQNKLIQGSSQGRLIQVKSGKISSRQGTLLAELTPTPKIISELRQWFPKARLVGWKYEVDGNRAGVIRLAENQIAECKTDACVANGPAYGEGFGLVESDGKSMHLLDTEALFEALEKFISRSVFEV